LSREWAGASWFRKGSKDDNARIEANVEKNHGCSEHADAIKADRVVAGWVEIGGRSGAD
jgi:hypothetical protein